MIAAVHVVQCIVLGSLRSKLFLLSSLWLWSLEVARFSQLCPVRVLNVMKTSLVRDSYVKFELGSELDAQRKRDRDRNAEGLILLV